MQDRGTSGFGKMAADALELTSSIDEELLATNTELLEAIANLEQGINKCRCEIANLRQQQLFKSSPALDAAYRKNVASFPTSVGRATREKGWNNPGFDGIPHFADPEPSEEHRYQQDMALVKTYSPPKRRHRPAMPMFEPRPLDSAVSLMPLNDDELPSRDSMLNVLAKNLELELVSQNITLQGKVDALKQELSDMTVTIDVLLLPSERCYASSGGRDNRSTDPKAMDGVRNSSTMTGSGFLPEVKARPTTAPRDRPWAASARVKTAAEQMRMRVAELKAEAKGRSRELKAMVAANEHADAAVAEKRRLLGEIRLQQGSAARQTPPSSAAGRHGYSMAAASSRAQALEAGIVSLEESLKAGRTAVELAKLELRRVKSLLDSFEGHRRDHLRHISSTKVSFNEAKLLADRRVEAAHIGTITSLKI